LESGPVTRVAPEESDVYFATRPRASQLSAHASPQSESVGDRETLEAEYRRIYGMTIPDVGIQAVTWRLSASSTATSFEPGAIPPGGVATPTRHRAVVFTRGNAAVATPVYRRADLGAGDRFRGPAIVEERETTVVVRPGWRVEVAPDGSIIATKDRVPS
jgi:N-methylhydantoinase A